MRATTWLWLAMLLTAIAAIGRWAESPQVSEAGEEASGRRQRVQRTIDEVAESFGR